MANCFAPQANNNASRRYPAGALFICVAPGRTKGSGVDKTNADPFCSSSNNRLFFHLAIGHKDQLPDDLAPMLDAYRVSRLAFPVLTGSVSNIVMSFFA
jgi:hypothetical protein